jgi:site-specific recombinase XerD
MLERYFVRPESIDRIRASWLGDPIERYVIWLTEKGYSPRNIWRRVPLLMHFGDFAQSRECPSYNDLPALVEPFVEQWMIEHGRNCKTEAARSKVGNEARGPVRQMLALVLPGYSSRSDRKDPFSDSVPGFFPYLRGEQGLRDATIEQYRYNLKLLAAYLEKIGVDNLSDLSPVILSAFIADRSQLVGKRTLGILCAVLRAFLLYLHCHRLTATDLSRTIEYPQTYRLSEIPRSITWDEVRRMLETVDRRSPTGKRDYAILLLLVTYGLRAREVAALTLDDIDWKRERIRVPERKAGHSTAYPLSQVVGEAILDYLQQGRPKTTDRHIFFRVPAPQTPMSWASVSMRAVRYLHKAGIQVPRPGSHTLRHTCVQRLVDVGFDLKTIGDYVGHRSPSSTEVYTKVAVESLREVALGDGEDVL